jgi:hypothetical protein
MVSEVPYELHDMELMEGGKEPSDLEVVIGGGLVCLTTAGLFLAGCAVALPVFAVNELIQQVKHGCYHGAGVPHERVSDSDFLPYYERI